LIQPVRSKVGPMQFSNFHQRESRRIPVEINLTSLVDIIFNLLLFYMLTANIAEVPGIEVSLPKASQASAQQHNKSLTIVIASDQSIFVDNKAISQNELRTKLRNFKKLGGKGRVLLKADKLAAHGNVVQILDLIKQNGIGEVAIATSSEN